MNSSKDLTDLTSQQKPKKRKNIMGADLYTKTPEKQQGDESKTDAASEMTSKEAKPETKEKE